VLGESGYLDYTIWQGSITAKIFLAFVEEKVLPHCGQYPAARSVLVLDNAKIHKSRRVQELCDERSVLLRFLPPYSADFNPTEATFKDLKSWVKRPYQLSTDFDDFSSFLEFAVSQSCWSHAKEHFREAGYIVD
jgi:transposase